MNRFVRVYLIPGAILQSVMIGGGYGTGREVVEYFTSHGVLGGFLGLATTTGAIAIVFTLSLELARQFAVYDYRNFFKVLLGRGWFLYEMLGVVLFMLVLAVLGAAAGTILQEEVGLPSVIGVGLMLMVVMVLVFFGRNLVTWVLAYWSMFLYLVFIAYLTVVFVTLGDEITRSFDNADGKPGWMIAGFQYTFYNIPAIPILLYSARAIETRREAIGSGIAGAIIAVLPAFVLHLSFLAQFPAILESPLPVYEMLAALDMPALKFFYLLVLFGTFVETGAGSLQGFIERLDGWRQEKHGKTFSPITHAAIAGTAMLLAGGLSWFGIIALIAEGFGTLAWGFLALYVVPLLTVGIYRLARTRQSGTPQPGSETSSSG